MPDVGALAVKSATGWWTATGIWTAIVGGVVAVTVAYIRQWGPWRKTEIDADIQLRSEMWKDIGALKAAKTEMGDRLTLAEAKIAGQQVEIGQQRFILNLVITELENVSPGNAIAKQARILMDQVQPAAFPRRAVKVDDDLIDKLRGEAK